MCYAFGCAYLRFSAERFYAFFLRAYCVRGEHDVGRVRGFGRCQALLYGLRVR